MIVERQHPLGFTYRTVATGVKFSETPAPCSLVDVGATDDYDSFLTTQILDTSACRIPVYRDSGNFSIIYDTFKWRPLS